MSKWAFMDDVAFLESMRLRAALAGRAVVLVDAHFRGKKIPRRARVVLPHGRIVSMADAEAVGIDVGDVVYA